MVLKLLIAQRLDLPKELNLKGKEGEKIIRLLTKKILIRHEKTFKRLSEM